VKIKPDVFSFFFFLMKSETQKRIAKIQVLYKCKVVLSSIGVTGNSEAEIRKSPSGDIVDVSMLDRGRDELGNAS